ncbi:MAG: hypothetical protein Q8P18_18275 [Pseudomonadota bacterium]|nr:hypothetical protein [Pseudomonadota bacterium]
MDTTQAEDLEKMIDQVFQRLNETRHFVDDYYREKERRFEAAMERALTEPGRVAERVQLPQEGE